MLFMAREIALPLCLCFSNILKSILQAEIDHRLPSLPFQERERGREREIGREIESFEVKGTSCLKI